PAEAVDQPVLVAPLGPDRPDAGLHVAQDHLRRPPEAQLREGVERLERVVEELAVVVDPAEPVAGDQLVAEDLPPEPVDLLALREEPVAADVEAVALVHVRPADPADEPRLGLE